MQQLVKSLEDITTMLNNIKGMNIKLKGVTFDSAYNDSGTTAYLHVAAEDEEMECVARELGTEVVKTQHEGIRTRQYECKIEIGHLAIYSIREVALW